MIVYVLIFFCLYFLSCCAKFHTIKQKKKKNISDHSIQFYFIHESHQCSHDKKKLMKKKTLHACVVSLCRASAFITLWQDGPYRGWVVFMCDITLLRASTDPSHSDTRRLIAHCVRARSPLLASLRQHSHSHTPSISINTQKVHWKSPRNFEKWEFFLVGNIEKQRGK